MRFLATLVMMVLMLAGSVAAATVELARTHQGDGPVRIVATTGMVADLARVVGGDRVEVTALMGPGIDPHSYKATAGDLRKLREADLVLFSGLHLEAKLSELLHRLGESQPVAAVTGSLDRSQLINHSGLEGGEDPHVWFDVAMWSECAGHVGEVLATFDAAHAEAYRARATAHRAELTVLEAEVRAAVATIPESQRLLVTAHDAFSYFGRAYGVRVEGVQGLSTLSEAGVKRINDLVDLLVANKVGAVFVESTIPDRNIRALIEGTRARGHVVRLGGELYSDAMGAAGTPEGTYLGMVRHNVKLIAEGLR